MLKRLFLIISLIVCGQATADDAVTRVQVAEPFIELHTGPGRGYPVFYVVERDEWIDIIKRKNNWFKIRYQDKKTGWAPTQALEKTLDSEGAQTRIHELDLGEFSRRRGEVGVLAGSVGGADSMTLYGGYAFTPNISTELSVSQAVGNFSNNIIINAKLLHQGFPRWRHSPFIAMGMGSIRTTPRATLVQAEDRSDMAANIGIGLRSYISSSFALRAEYSNYVVFSSDDDNEEIKEWKIGLVSFF